MWLGVVTTLALLTLAHANNQKTSGRNGYAEWGWQMREQGPGSVGHYYVRLPESEQQVRYIADGSGYHGALAYNTKGPQHSTTSNFALGRRALELDSQISSQVSPGIPNEIQEASATSDLRAEHNPLEFFLLQTHYTAPPNQPPLFQLIPDQNLVQYNPIPNIYFNDLPKAEYYNYVQHKNGVIPDQNNLILLNNNQNEGTQQSHSENVNKPNGQIEVVQVFKDSNCSNNDVKQKNHIDKESAKLELSNGLSTVDGNFGEKEIKPLYRGTVHFKVESPRSNARNEKMYYSSLSTTPNSVTLTEEEGISRLVASTQDLISNDDLLKINHAEESSAIYSQNDDLIKAKPRFSVRSQGTFDSQRTVPQSHVSVSTKYGNIVNTKTQHIKNERNNKQLGEQTFKSPIIVSDADENNFKQKVVNNLISTMVPYLEDGYELVGVRNSLDEDAETSDEDLVNITPRPISQNYLRPITVALRLLESNNTDYQDHDISESENILDTAMPEKERTIIEIQHSIPIEITHINDVEYHREYMDEGRNFNYGNVLHNQYRSSESNNARPNQNTDFNDRPKKNSNDNEQSGNAYSEVHVNPNQQQDNRNYHHEIVQPIIIEKEVPVTKFVDRYIEKQVPYPERVEVVKEVPVDRPVHVPVRYDRIVEKPVEVTRYVDKPYPVEVLKPYPVEVRVPYPVEHKVYVDRPVHVPYAVEKVVEKNVIHPVAIPTPVAVPFPVEQKVLYPVPVEKPVDRIVHKEVPVPYPVEKRVPYPVHHEVKVPVPYPVERRIPVTVEKPVTKIVEKHIKVPVPHPVPYEVQVPKPYPVDRIVERKVPYPVHIDRIVEKKVPVQVPYPVNTVVEKIVEKPVIVTKYVDKPYPVEKRVPYPVDRIVERRVPYPVEVKVPYQQKPDTPYQFEQIDPIYYGYGKGYQNPIQYIPKVSTLQQNQQLQDYMQAQAESQRNYQVQKASDEYLKSLYKQNIPVHSTLWGNQYASTYSYINTTDKNYFPTNYIGSEQKYYGPPPTKAYNFTWEKNQDYDKRRTDRAPKNLRIEYGGFKPPLIPSTEVDLDGNPIKKQT
ncbi:uncharacterized protein LOC125052692 [Pieris napi]|uniref:uncharacterized protein LOC125052692 n=1 Tax=Pieris napi TaxID=78633 RepID=UPI001FB901A8|nr:uncharacterized protein LOC125052692 [Pieris napi]